MWEVIAKWLPWVMLFVLFTALLALLHKKFKENNVWANIADKYRENMDGKMKAEVEKPCINKLVLLSRTNPSKSF